MVKENENIQFEFLSILEEGSRYERTLFVCEIDTLGRFVECKGSMIVEDYSDGRVENRYYPFGMSFKYGQVDELDLLVKLQVAKNATLAD